MRFSTFWKACDSPVWAGDITSTREVCREIWDVSKGGCNTYLFAGLRNVYISAVMSIQVPSMS